MCLRPLGATPLALHYRLPKTQPGYNTLVYLSCRSIQLRMWVQAQVNPAHSAHSTYITVTAAATVAPTRALWASVGDGGFAAKRAFFAWVTDVGSSGRGGGSGGGGSAFQNRLNPLAADQIALAFYLYPRMSPSSLYVGATPTSNRTLRTLRRAPLSSVKASSRGESREGLGTLAPASFSKTNNLVAVPGGLARTSTGRARVSGKA
ncbi:uncharacterized protein LY79DRAFT_662830 [Colletotrichum navitas]|uniref:Uncharacterized protein n=1 Tax=Colletotrichum navitas TaxID=681940 RepID=A0AAD8PNE4_9PEZI|nr:uncharacterized protein LY79DRAFT_662830 [Colletotrichum navitas]KAK1573376.1 hypothetical protein LY79DRAFT_662830 [Colletotrichum navitas]